MAKVLTDIPLIREPFSFRSPEKDEQIEEREQRFCANGCGPIIPDKETYWESLVTGEWYCDKVCMVKAEGARWEGSFILYEGLRFTESQWKIDREVIEHG